MFRKPASLIVAIAALVLASPLATSAMAQERQRDDNDRSQSQRPRVSPNEARRGAAPYGTPIDTQPRRDGNYSVLVERGGRVREVVVDGQTGRGRQSEGDTNNRGRNNDRNRDNRSNNRPN